MLLKQLRRNGFERIILAVGYKQEQASFDGEPIYEGNDYRSSWFHR